MRCRCGRWRVFGVGNHDPIACPRRPRRAWRRGPASSICKCTHACSGRRLTHRLPMRGGGCAGRCTAGRSRSVRRRRQGGVSPCGDERWVAVRRLHLVLQRAHALTEVGDHTRAARLGGSRDRCWCCCERARRHWLSLANDDRGTGRGRRSTSTGEGAIEVAASH